MILDHVARNLKKQEKEQIDGLIKRKAFIKVHKKDFPTGSNILGDRSLLSLKNIWAPGEARKARFVVQGYAHCDENMLVHASVNIK